MFGVGGCIHIVFDPIVEHVGVDGAGAVVGDAIAIEIVAGGCLKVAAELFAHK